MPNDTPPDADSLLLWSTERGVTTLTMNNPRRLNGWTMEMTVSYTHLTLPTTPYV